jgi:hypothetical protein
MALPATRGPAHARATVRDPERMMRRGRAWLWFGFAVCPCHLPLTLLAVGTLFGGTAVGAAITGSPLAVGVALGAVTALAYVKGWRLVRAAEACRAGGCVPTSTTTDEEHPAGTRP